jgi:hypothetical protein
VIHVFHPLRLARLPYAAVAMVLVGLPRGGISVVFHCWFFIGKSAHRQLQLIFIDAYLWIDAIF